MVEQTFVPLQALVTMIDFVMLGSEPRCSNLPTADPMRIDYFCHTGIMYLRLMSPIREIHPWTSTTIPSTAAALPGPA